MEWVLHNIYVVAIKDAHAWYGDTPFELSMIGYWNLVIVWLKVRQPELSFSGLTLKVGRQLLLPWRFFRLWSLLDGCDPPENMVRCMSDNFSTQGFWRSWHRSFNLWIVRCARTGATFVGMLNRSRRYIYIPIGGSQRVVLATLLVFTFVALWHDLSLRLLTWGWAVSLFVLPELAASWAVPYRKVAPWLVAEVQLG